jgi:hypothetical protein
MAPVFFLVLDEDIRAETALLYPELYKELLKVCRVAGFLSRVEIYHLESDYIFYRDVIYLIKHFSNGSSSVSIKVTTNHLLLLAILLGIPRNMVNLRF